MFKTVGCIYDFGLLATEHHSRCIMYRHRNLLKSLYCDNHDGIKLVSMRILSFRYICQIKIQVQGFLRQDTFAFCIYCVYFSFSRCSHQVLSSPCSQPSIGKRSACLSSWPGAIHQPPSCSIALRCRAACKTDAQMISFLSSVWPAANTAN